MEIVDQPKQKRHRRTKAEMELVREIVCEIDDQRFVKNNSYICTLKQQKTKYSISE